MRVLAVSLISAVFVATVGLGWLFDYVFSHYWQDEGQAPISSVSAVEKLGLDIQDLVIAISSNRQEAADLISKWPSRGSYQLSLLPMQSVSLPKDLKDRLLLGLPLTLASDTDIAIYYYLPHIDELMVLTTALLNQTPTSSLNRYLFTGLFYLCLLLLMLLWLYPLLKRLLALRMAAKRFGQGQLEQRVPVGSASYIRDLEVEFNHMAQRISDLIADVKLLSSAVSHDLRTPLATIRFGLDTLQEEDDPELRKKFEHRISDNVDQMIELVEILLNYARLDQSLVTLEPSRMELKPMLAQLIELHSVEGQAIQLQVEESESHSVFADKRYLHMLLNNLVKNATQHCKQTVSIAVVSKDSGVAISVSDDGKGVDEADRVQIIKPFVRGKAEHKGYGVGLAIVQRIVHWHKGNLEIDQDPELGGARFTVWLPENR